MELSAVKNKTVVLFQAFGEEYWKQATYSVLSLLNQYKQSTPFTILILTDNSSKFAELERRGLVQTLVAEEELLKQWDKFPGYYFRRKIGGFIYVQEKFQASVMLVDVDTVFCGKIDTLLDAIERGGFVLQKREYNMEYSRKIRPNFLPYNLCFITDSKARYELNEETYMWNSGVIGVGWQKQETMKDVLNLLDSMYEKSPYSFFEQMAASVAFSKAGHLIPAGKAIWHYWSFKNGMQPYLNSIWNKNVTADEQMKKINSHWPRLVIYTNWYLNAISWRLALLWPFGKKKKSNSSPELL